MAFSVPFADLPLEVLENIAFHVVVAPSSPSTSSVAPAGLTYYVYDPPKHLPPSLAIAISRLPPLLAVSKSVYQALSPGIASSTENGAKYPLQTELYARLCCEFLDVKAVGRRWRGPMRRNRTGEEDEDAWDKDVRGVPNAALTAHLVQVCRLLRFLVKAANEFDIPLPAQVLSEARLKKYTGWRGASLYNAGIENTLINMVVLMMEDDGKNHHQLRLVSAPLFIDILVFNRLNEGTAIPLPGPRWPEYRYNDGWPVESILNTAAVWLLWLFTTPEKIACESRPIRERLISLLLPYALCPYRYASALVPPTHFTLPLLADTDDVYARPCASMTAHGSFPVYHAYPPCPLPPDSNASSPTPASHTTMTEEAAAAAPPIIAGQREEEDPSNNNAQPQHEAASNGPSTSNPAAAAAGASTSAAASPNILRDRDANANTADGGSTAPTPPTQANANANTNANSNSNSPSPRGSPVPQQQRKPVSILSAKPPPDSSNSQAHPSFGVRFPWYCSPYEEADVVVDATKEAAAEKGWKEGVRLRDVTTTSPTPNETSRTSSRANSRSASCSSPSSSPLSTSLPTSLPRINISKDALLPKPDMIVLYLPLISASAKLVYMSRREIAPLPVLEHLPVDREAARRLQRRFAGPTQEDMREVGQWCTWGRRQGVGVAPVAAGAGGGGVAGSTAPTAATTTTTTTATATATTPAATTATVGTPPPNHSYAPPSGVDENDDGMRYNDSQRWDVDWWRMRVCGGKQWFLRDTISSSWSPSSPSSSAHPPSPSSSSSPASSPPLYPSPSTNAININAYRLGTVYEKGMLTGLWQGYMHIPNEASLNLLVHNRLFANNFSEGTLGVLMRPMFMRLEEHVWVPTVEDPGRFGGAGAKVGGEEEDKEGCSYEDVGPRGNGPVPTAKPTIMSTVIVEDNQVQVEPLSSEQPVQPQVQVLRRLKGFLDENMNNAWIPGPVASFKFEEGYTTSEGKVLKAEDGVSGVFGDQILPAQQGESGKQNMKSVTMVVPDTYAPSEGIPWKPYDATPPAAGAAGAGAGACAAPAARGRWVASLSPTPGSGDAYPVRFTLDNPNYPGHNVLPINEEEEARRVIVKGRKHVYETYHPPPYTTAGTAARNSDGSERESVHQRMERAKGREVCKGRRLVRRRPLKEGEEGEGDTDDNVDMERGLEVPGPVEEYFYAHPGCLKCKERERVVQRRVKHERKMRKEKVKELWEKRGKEMEVMFASVGLGRENVGRREELEDEDEDRDEKKDIVLDLDLNSEDVGMGDGEELDEEEEGEDEDEDDEGDVRNIERDIPPCEDIAEDVIVTGEMDDRHAEAWGRFVYYGRVRPWDGLIGIVRIGVSPENAGMKFFFYGYIYGGRSFVGNWRYATADPVVPSVESSFVLSRRADH